MKYLCYMSLRIWMGLIFAEDGMESEPPLTPPFPKICLQPRNPPQARVLGDLDVAGGASLRTNHVCTQLAHLPFAA